AVAHPSQNLARALQQLLAARHVVEQGRARQIQRALLIQDLRVDRADGTAGLAEESHQTSADQAVQALLERGFPDRVVDDVYAPPVGDAPDLRLEVLGSVVDRVIRSGLARDRRFLRRSEE